MGSGRHRRNLLRRLVRSGARRRRGTSTWSEQCVQRATLVRRRIQRVRERPQLAGAEIYKALGAGDNISYFSAVQSGSHCAMRPEWSAPLRSNLRRFLTKTGTDPGAIKAAASATGELSSWVDWTTPLLN